MEGNIAAHVDTAGMDGTHVPAPVYRQQVITRKYHYDHFGRQVQESLVLMQDDNVIGKPGIIFQPLFDIFPELGFQERSPLAKFGLVIPAGNMDVVRNVPSAPIGKFIRIGQNIEYPDRQPVEGGKEVIRQYLRYCRKR